MASEKKAAWVVFKMDQKMSTDEWRERFSPAYDIIYNLPGLYSKCYWVNQEREEWGALYVFDSEEDLDSYLTSDLWVNKIPAKFGCKPEVTILDPGPIIAKEQVSAAKDSWLTN